MLGSVRTLLPLLLLALFARAADVGDSSVLKSLQWSDRGDRLFRDAQFTEAAAAYRQAVELDRTNVRGHLGMGKIAVMLSDVQAAARSYSAAYQLAPLDPDAILGFANAVEDRAARQTLLRNFLSVAKDQRAEDIKARLLVADRIGTDMATVENTGRSYQLPLKNAGQNGLLLDATINQGWPLKLLVDTGASGIILNATAASKMPLDYVADAAISGFGSEAPTAARIARAASFQSGELRISNLPLEVAQADLIPGVDGVIGLDVFRDFLIRLDAHAHRLELVPLAESDRLSQPPAFANCRRIYRLGHLLLVSATINGHAQKYFLIDSGSPYSLISRSLIFHDGASASFEGAQGRQIVSVQSAPVTIQIGDQSIVETRYASFDNYDLSARYGTEIAGVLGYSFLRAFTLTFDYRAGLVRFEKR